MNGEERKLKRGLKDISNLFLDESRSREPASSHGEALFLKCVGVYQPFKEKIQFAPHRLAKALSEHEVPCSVLSIGKVSALPNSDGVSHAALDWAAFENLCRQPLLMADGGKLQKQMVLFDFDERHPSHLQAVVPLLDRWIFLVPPSLDGIMEAYRMMKGTRSLAQGLLQYYLLFEGPKGQGETDSFLFEKFSTMASDRLGINLVWLGYLNPSQDTKGSKDLDLDNFFLADNAPVEMLGKFAVLNYAAAFFGQESGKMHHEDL